MVDSHCSTFVVVGCWLLAVGRRSSVVGCGLWVVCCGLCVVGCGFWVVECGLVCRVRC